MKHTPGPWAIGLDGMSIVAESGDDSHGIPIRPCVATVKQRLEATQANAKLIAAAPDLLKCLNAVMMAPVSSLRPGSEIWAACGAAIAKATQT